MTAAATAITTAYALAGATIVQVIGLDAETGMVMCRSEYGEDLLLRKSALLALRFSAPTAVQVVWEDEEIFSGQVIAVSRKDGHGNQWAIVRWANNTISVVHTSRVLVS